MRWFLLIVPVLALLAGCSSGDGGPSPTPVQVTVSSSPGATTSPSPSASTSVVTWQSARELTPFIDTCAGQPDATIVGYWGVDGSPDSAALASLFAIRPGESTAQWLARQDADTAATKAMTDNIQAAIEWLKQYYPTTAPKIGLSFLDNRDWSPLFYSCLASKLKN